MGILTYNISLFGTNPVRLNFSFFSVEQPNESYIPFNTFIVSPDDPAIITTFQLSPCTVRAFQNTSNFTWTEIVAIKLQKDVFALAGEAARYYEDAYLPLDTERWILSYSAPWRFMVVDIPHADTWVSRRFSFNITIRSHSKLSISDVFTSLVLTTLEQCPSLRKMEYTAGAYHVWPIDSGTPNATISNFTVFTITVDVDWKAKWNATRIYLGLSVRDIEFDNDTFSISTSIRAIPWVSPVLPRWGIAAIVGGIIATLVLMTMVLIWSQDNSTDYSPLG